MTQLVGYYNPTATFPSPVVPIMELENELVAAFISDCGESLLMPLRSGFQYVKFTLCEFDYTKHRLFAYDISCVSAYDWGAEEVFLRGLLSSDFFQDVNPFVRLSLVDGVNDRVENLSEVLACSGLLRDSSEHVLANEIFARERERVLRSAKSLSLRICFSQSAIYRLLGEEDDVHAKEGPRWMQLGKEDCANSVLSMEAQMKCIWSYLKRMEYDDDIIQETLVQLLRRLDRGLMPFLGWRVSSVAERISVERKRKEEFVLTLEDGCLEILLVELSLRSWCQSQ